MILVKSFNCLWADCYHPGCSNVPGFCLFCQVDCCLGGVNTVIVKQRVFLHTDSDTLLSSVCVCVCCLAIRRHLYYIFFYRPHITRLIFHAIIDIIYFTPEAESLWYKTLESVTVLLEKTYGCNKTPPELLFAHV